MSNSKMYELSGITSSGSCSSTASQDLLKQKVSVDLTSKGADTLHSWKCASSDMSSNGAALLQQQSVLQQGSTTWTRSGEISQDGQQLNQIQVRNRFFIYILLVCAGLSGKMQDPSTDVCGCSLGQGAIDSLADFWRWTNNYSILNLFTYICTGFRIQLHVAQSTDKSDDARKTRRTC